MRNGTTRREFLKAGAAGLCVLALGGRPAAAEARKRPNVLLITTDQQRVSAMSAVDNKWVKTPNMDAIAAGGVYFTQRRTRSSSSRATTARGSPRTAGRAR